VPVASSCVPAAFVAGRRFVLSWARAGDEDVPGLRERGDCRAGVKIVLTNGVLNVAFHAGERKAAAAGFADHALGLRGIATVMTLAPVVPRQLPGSRTPMTLLASFQYFAKVRGLALRAIEADGHPPDGEGFRGCAAGIDERF